MNPPDYAEKLAEAMGEGMTAATARQYAGGSQPLASYRADGVCPHCDGWGCADCDYTGIDKSLEQRGTGPLAYFRNRPHRDKPLAE